MGGAPVEGSPGATTGNAEQIVASSSTNSIPAVALAAYQRAQSVIDSADPSCHLSWQLLAAIGRVESNHGRFGGSALNAKGIDTPSVYGVKLNIADTDGGVLDGETAYDRAVGPMQFIPSTWQAVAVDADGDGQRNPQDINDAALGAAVYLCSGNANLATTAGQSAAVYRYNHSRSYVTLVLAIMDAYLDGDYLASPDSTTAAGYLTPLPAGLQHMGAPGAQLGSATASRLPGSSTDSSDSTSTSSAGTNAGGKDGGKSGSGAGSGSAPKDPGSPDLPGVPGLGHPQLPTLPKTGVKPVDTLLTTAQAMLQCTLDGYIDNPLSHSDKFDVCVADYTTTGKGPAGESPSKNVVKNLVG